MALPRGILAADQLGGPSKIFMHYEDHCCQAVIARATPSGVLVCIPRSGIPDEVFEAAEVSDYADLIGPYSATSVYAMGSQGRRSRRFLEVVIFDLDTAGLDHLVSEPPVGSQDPVTFGEYRGVPDWPHTGHLLEIVGQFLQSAGGRLESYFSAEEIAAQIDGVEAASETDDLLRQLLSQAAATQRTVTGMQDRLNTLSEVQARLEKLEKQSVSKPLQNQPYQAALAPQLFDHVAIPLENSRKEKLQALAGRGPNRVGDLGAQPKGRPVATPTMPPAGTIAEEDPEDSEDAPEPLAGGNVLEQLLASQTRLLEKLASSKASQQDPLHLLAGSSSHDSDETSRASGVKGIAARQLLAESFRKNPEKVLKVFRERLAVARRKSGPEELEPRDLWLHMQETVPLGTHRTLTYVGFQAAAMFEALERGDLSRLKMLVALQAVFVEQSAYDGGALRLGHLLTCLEDPPFSQTELHRVAKVDFANGQLSDPRWLAAQLGYLRDVEVITDKAGKFARSGHLSQASPSEESSEAVPKAKPKWKPKRIRRNSQEPVGEAE